MRRLRAMAMVILRWSVPCAAAALLALCAFLFWIFLSSPASPDVAFEEARQRYTASDGVLLDRHGAVIHELRVDNRARRLEWVPLEGISPAMKAAIIRAEDQRFYRHSGVDWAALLAAARDLLGSDNLRGASTIPMQLAAKLDRSLRPSAGRRSVTEKIRQMRAARALTERWTKDQMLEAYLNLVTFRSELQGIAAASAGLFDKRPHGLDGRESAILAALVRSPNAAPAQAASRAAALAASLQAEIVRDEVERLALDVLTRPYRIAPAASLAPHVARRLLGTGQPRGIARSTLDGALQRLAAESLRRHLDSVRAQNVNDGAVLVAENSTGDILAYVGNEGAKASAQFVDGTRAPRQAGSTLKPFLFGLAFEMKLLTPASLLEDSPLDIPVTGGVYRPRNYDSRFQGTVTVRTALASSLNVPAVRALGLLGVDTFIDRLRMLGLSNLREADYYGPSLALGSADVTLWDLVNAYRCLANGGMRGSLRLSETEDSGPVQRALSEQAAFLLADILSDRESRSRTFSLESPLSTRFWTAVKTGTSKDMRDNWCIGFSEKYTVGVWAGNFSGTPMWNVTGVTGAAPVWVEIMNWLHRGVPSRPPAVPAGIHRELLASVMAGPGRSEWFLEGAETTSLLEPASRTNFRIEYPAPGTIIALDPDIPVENQKVFFEAAPESGDFYWVLDDNPFGAAGAVRLWAPIKGKHRLALVNAAGRTLDSVDFEVRGNLPGGK